MEQSALHLTESFQQSADLLYDAVSGLRLGRAGFDPSCQYDHFYVAGRLGEPPQARQWINLRDGSSVRSVSFGMSCIRHSLPGLIHKEFADQGQSSTSLVDETVESRLGPDLTLSDCRRITIRIRKLQADGLRMPRGIPRDTPLLGYVSFQSNLAVEPVSTRTTSRMAQNPLWDEAVSLKFVASPSEEVRIFRFPKRRIFDSDMTRAVTGQLRLRANSSHHPSHG